MIVPGDRNRWNWNSRNDKVQLKWNTGNNGTQLPWKVLSGSLALLSIYCTYILWDSDMIPWLSLVYSISAKCISATKSLWECVDVVRLESQDGQKQQLNTQRQWPSGASGSAGNKSSSWLDQCHNPSGTPGSIGDTLACIQMDKRQSQKNLDKQATRFGAPWNMADIFGSPIVAGTSGNCSYNSLVHRIPLTHLVHIHIDVCIYLCIYVSVYLCSSWAKNNMSGLSVNGALGAIRGGSENG